MISKIRNQPIVNEEKEEVNDGAKKARTQNYTVDNAYPLQS